MWLFKSLVYEFHFLIKQTLINKKSILSVERLNELVLEEAIGGCPGHIFEEEEHPIEELELFLIQESNLKRAPIMPDIYDLVLLFRGVLDPLNFGHIEFEQIASESEIFIQF